jgi:hypothetical protein
MGGALRSRHAFTNTSGSLPDSHVAPSADFTTPWSK